MNRRQKKKIRKTLIQIELLKSVNELDRELFPDSKPHYKVHVRHLPYHDAVTIAKINNLKIEVREDEQNHGRPHFHVTLNKNEQSVSIALDNFEVLAGGLDPKYMKTVMIWAMDNADFLRNAWQEFHGSAVQVA